MAKEAISAYATRLLLNYAIECGMDRHVLLASCSAPATVLLSDNRWTTFAEWSKLLHEVSKQLCLDPYSLGFNATMEQKRHPTKQTRILQVLPFSLLRKFLPYIIKSYINRNLNSVITDEADRIVLRVSPIDINEYSKDFCSYNRGVCAAIMNIRLERDDAILEETTCVSNGDLCCTYSMPRVFGKVDKEINKSIIIDAEDIDKLFKE